MRILLVDDLSDASESLEYLFRIWPGYAMCIATRGEQALATAREFNPDAVILDVGMPGTDGYELARCLRSEHGDKLTIIMVKGYGRNSDVDLAIDSGCDHHLSKPANPNEIRRILENR